MSAETLREALASLGIKDRESARDSSRRCLYYADTGEVLRDYSPSEAWELVCTARGAAAGNESLARSIARRWTGFSDHQLKYAMPIVMRRLAAGADIIAAVDFAAEEILESWEEILADEKSDFLYSQHKDEK